MEGAEEEKHSCAVQPLTTVHSSCRIRARRIHMGSVIAGVFNHRLTAEAVMSTVRSVLLSVYVNVACNKPHLDLMPPRALRMRRKLSPLP